MDPLGGETRFEHDARGNLTAVEDARGRRATLRYNERSERVEATGWEGGTARYTFDDLGRLLAQVDPRGSETRLTWDARGRLARARLADGGQVHLRRDAEGNILEREDERGRVTRYRYAGMNKLVERTDPAGFVVRFAYDTEENLTGVTNEAGETYTIDVDLAGRVIAETGFDGRRLVFRYDRAGRCREAVNAAGNRTRITRDAEGKIIELFAEAPPRPGELRPAVEAVAYGYDPCGRLVRAKNETHEVELERDLLGRVVRERAGEVVIESQYDITGDRVRRRTSLGHETAYGFDGNGDLIAMALDLDPRFHNFVPDALSMGGPPVRAPWSATLKRDALGAEVERRLPGGVVSRWERDRAGRPSLQRVSREDVQLTAVGYRFRSGDELAALIDTQEGPTYFMHDARSYLVAAARPDGRVEHRAPDAVGNVFRTAARADRQYAAGGRLEEADGARYAHDADGQLVEKVLPDGARWAYRWDGYGQLVEVLRPDGERVTFAYDALGRRVRKTFRGETTRYVWDGNDLVHELREGAPLVTWAFEPGAFALVAKVEGEKRYGVVSDHLGAPQALFDEAGELAWKAQLDVYGVARTDVMRTSCPWRWPGQYEDEETGLYYNRFRYYDPGAGRYISQDPIRVLGGAALYDYVGDPLKSADPLGLTECGWSSKRVKEAARDLEQGKTSIFVSTRSEAEELFLGLFAGHGYKNTTGMSGVESKALFGDKAGTYHWDEALDQFSRLLGHGPSNMDSKFRHLQIHPAKGKTIRIFFGEALW